MRYCGIPCRATLFVISAKAGIQWFVQYMPVCRGQTGMTADMSFLTTGANKQNRLTISVEPLWITACARRLRKL